MTRAQLLTAIRVAQARLCDLTDAMNDLMSNDSPLAQIESMGHVIDVMSVLHWKLQPLEEELQECINSERAIQQPHLVAHDSIIGLGRELSAQIDVAKKLKEAYPLPEAYEALTEALTKLGTGE